MLTQEYEFVKKRYDRISAVNYETEIPNVSNKLENTASEYLHDIYKKDLARLEKEKNHVAPLKAKLETLSSMVSRADDYKRYQSKYSYVRSNIKQLTDNLTTAIKIGHNKDSATYYNHLYDQVDWLKKEEKESLETYGMSPSVSVYIEVDEFGECAVPSHLDPFNADPLLQKYKPEEEYFTGTSSKIRASQLFLKYGTLLDTLNYELLEETVEYYKEQSWETAMKMLPKIDNNLDKLKSRLGYDGIINFIKDLDNYQVSYNTVYRSRNGMLQEVKDLYDAYGMRRSRPDSFDRNKIVQLEKIYSEEGINLHYYLNLPLVELMPPELMLKKSSSYI